jgi:ABC-type branched-subunit amino acid transport system substrate-binding protein
MRRLLTTLAVASLSLGAVVSTAIGTSSAAPKKGTITIGITDILSTANAQYGQAARYAALAVAGEFNATGGIDGKKIKVISLDDQINPTVDIANAKTFLSDKVNLISGITTSGSCAAVAPVVKTTPVLCMTIAIQQVVPTISNVFSRSPVEAQWAASAIQLLAKHTPNGAKLALALLPQNLPGTELWADQFVAEAPGLGATIASNQQVPATATTFAPQVAAILASGANAAVIEEGPPETASIDQGLREGGFTGPIIDLTPAYTSLVTLKDPLLYEVQSSQIVNPSATSIAVKAYVKAMGKEGIKGAANLNQITIVADYEGFYQALTALKACHGCTGAAYAKSIQNTKITLAGITTPGGWGYAPTRHEPVTNSDVYHWSTTANAPALVAPIGLLALNKIVAG